MKTLYLCGEIKNNPNYKEDFEKARLDLIKAGYSVVSPLIFCKDLENWKESMKKRIEVLLKYDAVAIIMSHLSTMRDLRTEAYLAHLFDMDVKTVEEWLAEGDNN